MMESPEEIISEVRKITQKIVGYRVKTEDTTTQEAASTETIPNKATKLERGEVLHGSTYKVKQPPLPEAYKHGFYLTINNSPVDGKLVPYEILIDTKNSDCWPMLSVFTLTLTTLFRHQLDINHLLDEYSSVQDGKGGYRGKKKSWQEKPKWYNSILGEFADVIEHHLQQLELTNNDVFDSLLYPIDSKDVFFGKPKTLLPIVEEPDEDVPNFPSNKSAGVCPSCHSTNTALMDNCLTCLDCSYSKCG